jgi:hypothetical protein
MKLLRTTVAAAVAAATALPLAANAASSFGSATTGTVSTTVDLNFNVVIPRFVFLRVGSATPSTVNTLIYAPTAAQILSSATVTPTGGDVGSDLTVTVLGNVGSVNLGASNLANLTDGTNNIPTNTLTATNPTGSIGVPAFGGNVSIPAASGIVNQTGTWRYTWANPPGVVYPAATYAGTVTYTASTP